MGSDCIIRSYASVPGQGTSRSIVSRIAATEMVTAPLTSASPQFWSFSISLFIFPGKINLSSNMLNASRNSDDKMM